MAGVFRGRSGQGPDGRKARAGGPFQAEKDAGPRSQSALEQVHTPYDDLEQKGLWLDMLEHEDLKDVAPPMRIYSERLQSTLQVPGRGAVASMLRERREYGYIYC